MRVSAKPDDVSGHGVRGVTMQTIQPGTIGVNTADDSGELLIVVDAQPHVLMARPLSGGGEHIFPTANFWPLISKLNIGG